MPNNNNYKGNKPKRNYNRNYNKNNYKKNVSEINSDNQNNIVETNGYTMLTAKSISESCFGFNIFNYYSSDEITNMVQDPITYNKQLRELSWKIYSSNGMFTQVVDYSTALPTLSYIPIPRGKGKKSRDNTTLFCTTLRHLKHKEIIRDSLLKCMIDGCAFYYAVTKESQSNVKTMSDYDVANIVEINELGVNLTLLPLPTDFTRIVGRRNNVYQLAFDLKYFELCTDEKDRLRRLKIYPDEISIAWNNYFEKGGNNWVLLDINKTFAVKIRSKIEEIWGRPIVLSALKDIMYTDYYIDTKRGVLDEINNRVIYQTLPEGKEKGTCALTVNQQEAQHNAVKEAILTKNKRNSTSFFTVASGTKLDKIDINTDILKNTNEQSSLNEQIGLDLGFMSNLLTGSGSGNFASQQNNLELLLSEILMWVEPMAEELSKIINKNIIKDPKNKVDVYYLPCSIITRDSFVSNMKDLYTLGGGSLRAWIASTGIDSDAYLALMENELEEGIFDKFKPHQTSYTLSNKDSKDNDNEVSKDKGRPSDETSTNYSTLQAKNNGGNLAPRV